MANGTWTLRPEFYLPGNSGTGSGIVIANFFYHFFANKMIVLDYQNQEWKDVLDLEGGTNSGVSVVPYNFPKN